MTIVVPVHPGRGRLLEAAFPAFDEARRRLAQPSQVIVVDDSPPIEAKRLQRACGRHDVHYVRAIGSAAVKRNSGARRASHDSILFLDSDCRPTPDLLVELLASMRRAEPNVAAVVGTTELKDDPTATWGIVSKSLLYNQCYRFPEQFSYVTWAPTSNICFDTKIFWLLGGFREDTWTQVGGEDVDIGVRAFKSGFIFTTNPAAVALHQRDQITSLAVVARSLFTYGRADAWLCSIHPERRTPHLNWLALASAAGLLGTVGLRTGRRWPGVAGAGVCFVGLARAAWNHYRQSVSANPYRLPGAQSEPRTRGWRVLLESLAAVVLDASFDAGVLVEAFRHRHPRLAMARFEYVDPAGFILRE